LDPRSIRFRYQAFGKPELALELGTDHHGSPPLRFNLSHSDGLALIAVTRRRAIGVDVERVRDIGDLDSILATAFSPRERKALHELDDAQRRVAFFRAWVCKEAFVKATGAGLSQAPSDVEVSFEPGRPARMLALNGDERAGARWALQDLQPAPDSVAAIVIEGPIATGPPAGQPLLAATTAAAGDPVAIPAAFAPRRGCPEEDGHGVLPLQLWEWPQTPEPDEIADSDACADEAALGPELRALG
jgi:phosphopantetheine--protein transferase-like protein